MSEKRIELRQSGTERRMRVTEETADFWRSLGYQDAKAANDSEPKKAAPQKRTAKKN